MHRGWKQGIVLLAGWLCAAATAHAGGIIFTLENAGPSAVLSGTPVQLNVRATFTEPLAAAAFRLSATGAANVNMTARSANPLDPNGLTYVSKTQQSPFQAGLPLNLKLAPTMEVLVDLDHKPPATDGLLPGSNVLLETITLVPTGSGPLTIALSDASGVTTQGRPDGELLDPVTYGWPTVELDVQLPPVCNNPRYDTDGDADVDNDDFGEFQACFTGAGDPLKAFVPNPCQCLDDNNDKAVDSTDLAAFLLCASGPSIPVNPACDD